MNHKFLYAVWWLMLRFCHPVFHVEGLENVPEPLNCVVVANHRGMSDPFWLLLALKPKKLPRVMAKAELMKVPILGRYLRSIGVFAVRRGENDVNAIKTAMKALRDGEGLVLFPEGTRIRRGKVSVAKSGAMLLAVRTETPILPVYLQTDRRLWTPMRVIIGKPFLPHASCPKPTVEELRAMSKDMMHGIYALGGST